VISLFLHTGSEGLNPMASVFFENGILIMLEACVFFTVFDSLTKYLVDSFTMGEIAFVRFGFGALIMFPSLLQQRFRINRGDFTYLVLRGLLGAGAFYSTILAFQIGALSVTMVLFFTSPLWALLMGALFLEESITRERMVCVVAAIVGIAMLINPWGEGIAFGHFYGLAAGMMGGANSVLTRYLRARHNSRVIYAFQCFVGTLFSIPFVIGHARMPELTNGMVLLIAAAFGLLGQVTMNHGFRFIRAAEGSTLLMAEAILTTVVGIIIFHEPLTFTFAVGTVMILGSGIYLGLRTGKDTIGIA
jgi:drug/metabolite transporter (DMT)-like permease